MKNKKAAYALLIAGGVLILVLLCIVLFISPSPKKIVTQNSDNIHLSTTTTGITKTLAINNQKITLELADTEALREHGLSDRTSLATSSGMLFVFPNAGYWAFWMKDTHFPLDMIWLDKDFKVVTALANIYPESYPTSFKPKAPALYVVEVDAGFIQNNKIEVGQKLDIH